MSKKIVGWSVRAANAGKQHSKLNAGIAVADQQNKGTNKQKNTMKKEKY